MSLREEQCNKVCRILDNVLANRPTERDSLIVAVRKAFAEPQEHTGRWIYGENDCQDGWYCSECKFFIPWDYDYYGLNNIDFIRDYHTCPHCDAKMLTYTGAKMEVDNEQRTRCT